jgi:hypothetical protein
VKSAHVLDSTPRTADELFVSRRAVLISLLTTLLSSPTHAQKATMPPSIGWLSAGSEPDPFLDGFREGLRKLAWISTDRVDANTDDEVSAFSPAGGS